MVERREVKMNLKSNARMEALALARSTQPHTAMTLQCRSWLPMRTVVTNSKSAIAGMKGQVNRKTNLMAEILTCPMAQTPRTIRKWGRDTKGPLSADVKLVRAS